MTNLVGFGVFSRLSATCRACAVTIGLGALHACASVTQTGASSAPAAQLSHPNTQGTIPSVELWRLDYALRSSAALSARWPWFTTTQTCILLIGLDTQWVLNCDDAPSPDFAPIEPRFRERPIYARVGGSFTLDGKDVPSSAFVQALPATTSVPHEGQQPSDLAHARPFVIVSSLDALVGLNPGFPAETTTEEWLSIFVHEFFHTRQLTVPTFADQLRDLYAGKLDPHRLSQLYEQDGRYRELVEREYTLLAQEAAQQAVDVTQSSHVLHHWRESYAARRDYLSTLPDGPELTQLDVIFTYLEGVARYVENDYLVDARLHIREPSADPHFHGFARTEAKGYAGMANKALSVRYVYPLGMHLALLLDRVDPSWTQRVHEHRELLIGTAVTIDEAHAR